MLFSLAWLLDDIDFFSTWQYILVMKDYVDSDPFVMCISLDIQSYSYPCVLLGYM